ncbi:hypothetical protein [Priestia taiwanensis]|uniref:DUF1433 domain-containing protein n=1 Tax=Priestia taiwanensis TaxID=1347902 RepID=A0A917EP62_9BACI|nr:hypothetical protein [Priestia taiwanensis]MBM7362404.1 hypothetical protein [Priestia taiwanensis]GGE61991.1 hypothetical protein GCM10007140_10280 [Priestia taiwanensis]
MNITKITTIIVAVTVIIVGSLYWYKNKGISEETAQKVERAVITYSKEKHNVDVVIERVHQPMPEGQFGPENVTVTGHVKDDKTKEIWALVNYKNNFEVSQISVNDSVTQTYYSLDRLSN